MIRIKFILGEFKIVNGELVEGSKTIRALYKRAQFNPIPVTEGQVDYALALRIVNMFGNDYEILESSDATEKSPRSV